MITKILKEFIRHLPQATVQNLHAAADEEIGRRAKPEPVAVPEPAPVESDDFSFEKAMTDALDRLRTGLRSLKDAGIVEKVNGILNSMATEMVAVFKDVAEAVNATDPVEAPPAPPVDPEFAAAHDTVFAFIAVNRKHNEVAGAEAVLALHKMRERHTTCCTEGCGNCEG